ncbi:TRAP transporter small permease subunit [Halomonas heilongjiangensis]|uniref:TRAP transporter small permease protein n=1 Tax=Halomonas heilongjiangensis TaxID=1387883 RepID=A0A2N7TUQ1_9GAMM|nr:TRAP transporter small permease [Halomonas heilongjiangensis]PMR71911.1 TRAP transporter small permease [Halomonas heilongjiangensis]PXX87504.1 hypothetical protein CR158_18460 [Halomonas heilongjiangensis]
MQRRITAGIDRLVTAGALIAGYAALGLSALITFEVIARKFFRFSLQGVDEIGGYVLAIGVAFSFAHALLQRAHTRVDVLLERLPAPLRVPLNLAAMLALAALAGFMAWRGIATLGETLEFGSRASTPLQTPLWIPQALWVAGLGLFALLALCFAGRALWLTLAGRGEAVNREFGPRTTEDELDEARQEYTAAPSRSPEEQPL